MTRPATAADAYSRTGAAWQRGPGLIYDRLAQEIVALTPRPLRDRLVLDLGAGTGAASRAVVAAGATVVAVDAAIGMLRAGRTTRPPAAVGDAYALPLRDRAVDGVIAAFSLNHVADPVTGLREAARVACRGGPLLVSAYAEDDTHPVKDAVEAAARAAGWEPPQWYANVRERAIPLLATVERARAAVGAAGLTADVHHLRVPFPHLAPRQLVEWRLGMAQFAPFVTALDAPARAALAEHALARLEPIPLVRSIVVIVATV